MLPACRAGIGKSLTLPGSRFAFEIFGVKHELYGIDRMLPGPLLHEPGKLAVVLCLVLVNEDLDNVLVCHELAHDEPL